MAVSRGRGQEPSPWGESRGRCKRPDRTAASRREQYKRAEARCIQSIMRKFQALQHRGCQASKLGAALQQALGQTVQQEEDAVPQKDASEEAAAAIAEDEEADAATAEDATQGEAAAA